MHRLSLFLVTVAACCTVADAAAPTPAPGQRFALPLSSGTTTQAVFLAAPENALHLIYATPSGRLIIYHVSQPEPDPGPIPPPPPPPVKLLRIAVIHEPTASTAAQRQIMADPAWRAAIQPPHEFCGIIPFGLIDPNTGKVPPRIHPFFKAAEGHTTPVIVILNENSDTITVEPLPASTAEVLILLKKHGAINSVNTNNRRKQHPRSATRKIRPIRDIHPGTRARLYATPHNLRMLATCA